MRPLALAGLMLSAAVGCNEPAGEPLSPGPGADHDAAIYLSCESICFRPEDCAVAYPDGEICPPGFRCASELSCVPDGG